MANAAVAGESNVIMPPTAQSNGVIHFRAIENGASNNSRRFQSDERVFRVRAITNPAGIIRTQVVYKSDSQRRSTGTEEAERINAVMMREYRLRSERALDPMLPPAFQPGQINRGAP